MKITCQPTQLADFLQIISELIPQSRKKPFTTVTCLKTDGHQTTLTAMDSKDSVHISLELDSVSEPGTIFLPHSKMLKILQLLDKPSLSISMESGKLQLADSNSYFKFSVPAIDDYPQLELIKPINGYISCQAPLLKRAIHLVNSIYWQSEHVFIADFILWRLSQDQLTLVATDGVRLIKTQVPIKLAKLPEKLDYFVRADSMAKLDKLLARFYDEVEFAFSGDNLIVRGPEVTFQTPIVETPFPNWEYLFSKEISAFRAEMKAWDLFKAIRQIMGLFGEVHSLAFNFKTNILRIFYRNPNEEMAFIEVPVIYDGPDTVVYLNPKFLLSFLRNIVFADLIINIKDSNTPIFFKTEENCDCVIIPMISENWKF